MAAVLDSFCVALWTTWWPALQ